MATTRMSSNDYRRSSSSSSKPSTYCRQPSNSPPHCHVRGSALWAHLLSNAPAQAGLMQQAPGIGTFGGLPGSSSAGGVCPPFNRTSRLVKEGTACAGTAMPQLAHPITRPAARRDPSALGAVGAVKRLSCAEASSLVATRLAPCMLACVQGAPTTPLARSLR